MAAKSSATTQERIGRIGQRRQVVIPRELFDLLRMSEGDFVAFTRSGNGLLVKPKKLVDAEDELTAQEAKKVKRGLSEIKQGKTKPWSQVKNEMGL
jgi:bifunctional DNA-binding transcriptional regulator/antitoxin component of YhaV-PrlF toxin-antitoxin module